ncbi:MAG: glycosyltransferase [Cyanomargarita calcarea GSE-NOS-MK-12-04C]|jgi:glycosyltransferase involved in cell wall biosynthesis|uniref:Glycosyltransferase n=1 Tax=Cyanomargarita calcarea GSE-NOS-MK-12-04C TaxID=2839659 RepID=A0A951QR07_9CYAN|nr:glycosyltransferase [Cyanomargarita calcarea GSE-NOS-MK-12-04C]
MLKTAQSLSLPKISIVTPSFNQAEFLEATIKSVISQEYPNLEYIIIDGGSTDGSIDIIKKYESHLHFWCSELDNGQYDAINKGFTHATGEILAWINSDDMFYPWTFQTIASIFSTFPQIEWLTTQHPGAFDYHGFWKGFRTIPGYSQSAFLDACYLPWGRKAFGWIQQESTFWRQSLWQKAGGIRTEYRLAGDFDLWSRFFCHAELYSTPSPLAGFRRQSGSRNSLNHRIYITEAEKSLNEMRELLNWSPSNARKIASLFQFNRIPKIRSWTKSMYAYQSKQIVRKKVDSIDGFWELQEYTFI